MGKKNKKQTKPFTGLCAVVQMIAQLHFHMEKDGKGGKNGLCAVIFRMTQFSSFVGEEAESRRLNSVRVFILYVSFWPHPSPL